MSGKNKRMQKLQKGGHCEKICRLLKRVEYIGRATLSVEEDNWDYEEIQKIHNEKPKKGLYYASLMVITYQSISLLTAARQSQ